MIRPNTNVDLAAAPGWLLALLMAGGIVAEILDDRRAAAPPPPVTTAECEALCWQSGKPVVAFTRDGCWCDTEGGEQ